LLPVAIGLRAHTIGQKRYLREPQADLDSHSIVNERFIWDAVEGASVWIIAILLEKPQYRQIFDRECIVFNWYNMKSSPSK
jgi:hypothetical protein